MFYDDAFGLTRVLIVGSLAYVSLIILLRISGKRTLSKMNAFDLVVTVALGSTLATVLLSKDVVFLEGVLAFALLIGLQFVIASLSVRYEAFEKIVKAEPTLLFHNGTYLQEAMRRERVTEEDVRSAIRLQGSNHIEQIEAVILEADGSFSTVARQTDSEKMAFDAKVSWGQHHRDWNSKEDANKKERSELS